MTTIKLIMLHLTAAVMGRTAMGSRLLKWFLLRLLVKGKTGQQRFTASARLFDESEL